MNKNYFRYLFKTRKVLILFFLAVYLVFCLMSYAMDAQTDTLGYGFYTSAKTAMILSTGLSFVLPVLLFSFVHRRSSADVYFALPVSRKEERITNLLFAFAVIYGYYAVTILTAFVIYGRGHFRLLHLALLLIYTAFALLTMLTVNSFLFLLGNTLTDGIIILAAYSLFPIALMVGIHTCIENMVAGISASGDPGMLLSPVFVLAWNYASLVSRNGWLYVSFKPLYFILAVVYLVIAWVGLKREFDERKTERAEMLSDHPLAYPTVINLYSLLFLLVFASMMFRSPDGSTILLYILLLVCFVAGHFLYRRKLELSWKQLALFAGELVLSILLMGLVWNTRGFGYGDRDLVTDPESDTLVYEYGRMVLPDDLGVSVQNPDGTITQDYVYVSFTAAIRKDELEENKELYRIVESMRQDAIDDWYSKRNQLGGGYLSVCKRKEGKDLEYFSYYPERVFTEEELKMIAEYCDVMVIDYAHPELGNTDYKLAEYLNIRKNF